MTKNLYLITVLILALTGCATRQEFINLGNRIDQIERKVSEKDSRKPALKEELQKELETGLKKESARLTVRYERMEDALRLLRGKIEEYEYTIKQQNKLNSELKKSLERSESKLSDLSAKLREIEKYTGFEPGEEAPFTPKPEKEVKSVPPNDGAIYAKAKKAFDLNSMEEAKAGFLEIIKLFPKSKNADNAQFWIGEIYYRNKRYKNAILEYQKVIENYPQGNKVAAAYLKQGLAFEKLGEKENAHLILNELIKKFPASPEAKIAAKKIGSGT